MASVIRDWVHARKRMEVWSKNCELVSVTITCTTRDFGTKPRPLQSKIRGAAAAAAYALMLGTYKAMGIGLLNVNCSQDDFIL